MTLNGIELSQQTVRLIASDLKNREVSAAKKALMKECLRTSAQVNRKSNEKLTCFS